MPRSPKESHGRELEDEEGISRGAPRVDENEAEDDERAQASLKQSGGDEDDERDELDVAEEDIAEEIDLDDLSAMEGPDA